jgi:two-component system OmpR family sensor kinase
VTTPEGAATEPAALPPATASAAAPSTAEPTAAEPSTAEPSAAQHAGRWMSRGLRSARRRWTLRRRLVVSIVALVALVSFGISLASVAGLNSYLVSRLDTQVVEAVERSVGGDSGVPGRPYEPDQPVRLAGLPVGSVAVLAIDDTVVGSAILNPGDIDENASISELATDEAEELLSVDASSRPETVSLGSELGAYRALAVTLPSGVELIIGLPLTEVQYTVAQFRTVVIAISALGVIGAAVASFFIVSLALRPLRRVAATATQVASLPLDRGEVSLAVRVPEEDTDPRTEVGQVGAAFNGMLGHVDAALRSRQASENKVRQFVADASHELRTPLASIRGYAELTRRGGHSLPDDVRHSMSRVESEAVRMTSLVEDLLLLARLDEGRELEKRPVNLGTLLVDCISDAYAAGPDHDWDLDAPEQGIVILGDQPRIHQVLANLLANARVHTPEGTHVAVALAAEGDTAVITVTDNGPGIPDALQPTLFERFARGDSSRSRTAGSTGLGLSIVQAVVHAHGGTVAVSSKPGATAFRIEFPGIVSV